MLGALGMSLAVLVTSSVAGYAAESVSLKDKNFEYSIDKNTEGTKGIFITKYIGSDKKVTIPDAIDGKKVIEIGERAFFDNKNIEEISMPNGLRFASHATMIAVKPTPPATDVESVCSRYPLIRKSKNTRY